MDRKFNDLLNTDSAGLIGIRNVLKHYFTSAVQLHAQGGFEEVNETTSKHIHEHVEIRVDELLKVHEVSSEEATEAVFKTYRQEFIEIGSGIYNIWTEGASTANKKSGPKGGLMVALIIIGVIASLLYLFG